MSGLDARQLFDFVIRPSLFRLAPHIPDSKASAQLVLGTAIVESQLVYIDQLGVFPGPAYGLWQIERGTFDDHLRRLTPALEPGVYGYFNRMPRVEDLHWNLLLGAAMCRVIYWHAPEKIPLEGDFRGMAELWKKRYNTPLGAGTVEKAIPAFMEACSL